MKQSKWLFTIAVLMLSKSSKQTHQLRNGIVGSIIDFAFERVFSLSLVAKITFIVFFMIYGCRHCKRVMLTSHNQSVRNSIHIISYNLFQYAQVASTCCWCFCCCLLFLIYDASNNDVFNTIQTDEPFRCSLVFVWLAVICSIFESIYLRKASIFILLLFSVRMNAMNTYEI